MMKRHRTIVSPSTEKNNASVAVLAVLIITLSIFTFSFFVHRKSPISSSPAAGARPLPKLPRLAYLITGDRGDGERIKRVLMATYHPWNFYILSLDVRTPPEERKGMEEFVGSEQVFSKFGNVWVMGVGNTMTQKGPTAVSIVLHAAAFLLRKTQEFSWFINLGAEDYPLIPQDDLLHVFSYLPRDLNFIEHTSSLGWKEYQRARPIIIDPGLYSSNRKEVFWSKERRALPASFKLFAGSSSMILSLSFMEFCIWGWDNLPRTLLMYFTNSLWSEEGYFHTVICNSKDFQNTTVNHHLQFMLWDKPFWQRPLNLTLKHFDQMVESGAPFARAFAPDDPVLDRIDLEVLRRAKDGFAPGGWCMGSSAAGADPCTVHVESSALRPSSSSSRLEGLLLKLLEPGSFRPKQCK